MDNALVFRRILKRLKNIEEEIRALNKKMEK
jgi:hypothetical protein